MRADSGPLLIGAALPRDQDVADAHSPRGVAAVNLPATYPLDANGDPVPHARCQPIGQGILDAGLRGVRARSAQSPNGTGRELAWFPATARSRARRVETLDFERWFWD